MLDLGWPEVIVIGAVALVAIGPKDMPKALYALGRFAGKAQAFIKEMRRTFDQITAEAELADKSEENKPEPPNRTPR